MRKYVVYLLMIMVVVSLVFVGCKETIPEEVTEVAEEAVEEVKETEEATVEEAPDIELVFWAYPFFMEADKEENELIKEIITEFEKKFPNVSVKLENIPWNTGPEKVNIAIASSTTPDFLIDFQGRIIPYAAEGVLVPLNDMLTEEDKADLFPAAIELGSLDGELYLYPWGLSPVALAVNKGLVDEELLNLDSRTWTIEEFENVLRSVATNELNGMALCAMNQGADSSMRALVQSFGAEIFNPDRTEVVFNSELAKEGLRWLIDLYNEDNIIMPGAESLTSTDVGDLYFKGLTAVNTVSSGYVVAHETKLKGENTISESFESVYMAFPNAEGVEPGILVDLHGICLFKNDSDDQKIKYAKEFIKFFAVDYQEREIKLVGTQPTRKSVKGYDDERKNLAFLTENVNTVFSGAGLAVYSKIRDIWYPEFQAALIGAKTPDQALDDFTEKANEFLTK